MENDQSRNSEESTSEYYDATKKDLQNLELLQTQAGGQISLILGYIFELIATNQAMELITFRMAQRDIDFYSGNYINEDIEKAKYGVVEEEFKNKGVDADKAALTAAYFELFGQSILTCLDAVKLQRFNQNTEDKDYLISKTANDEVFIGALLGQISFIYNLQGVTLLYEISNQDALDD